MRREIHRKVRRTRDGVSVVADLHVVTEVNTGDDGPAGPSHDHTEEEPMTNREPLTEAELEAQTAEELPDREAMSLINANVAAPVNAAVALNALSDDGAAIANAEQTAFIDQSN